jgi:hypothetical protein
VWYMGISPLDFRYPPFAVGEKFKMKCILPVV